MAWLRQQYLQIYSNQHERTRREACRSKYFDRSCGSSYSVASGKLGLGVKLVREDIYCTLKLIPH